ncbi:MAG: lipid-binding SYLF domain-containing protein [Verrucomicrobiota bacterium]
MKKRIVSMVFVSAALAASALDRADLDGRIHALTYKFESLQMQPDKRIPADVLRRAQGIILLDRTKAGIVFAYEGGGGVALAKDPKTGRWSAPAFLTASHASLGIQIGGEQNFFAILLMTTNAPRVLTDPHVDFGGDARGTAGDSSAGAGAAVSDSERPVLVYDSRKGLYGGVSIKGGSIAPDETANRVYYGEALAMRDILYEKKVEATPVAKELIGKIVLYSRSPGAQESVR